MIAPIQVKVRAAFAFLIRSAYLWRQHFIRMDSAKEMILRDLLLTIRKNNKTAQVLCILIEMAQN